MPKKHIFNGQALSRFQHGVASLLFAIAGLWLLDVANLNAQQPIDSQDTQPNIVLIMADDLGWKDLHCYGNKNLETPNLDRLAKQGMLFTNAYSASPVCTPTRAAMMTGESPARLNITNHAPGHPPGYQKPGTKIRTAPW